jgi:hypothetical protein
MPPSDAALDPRYSVRATRRGASGILRRVRLEFYEDTILIYRHHSHLWRDGDYALLRRADYSDVRRYEYVAPRVASGSTFTGFVWAPLPAEIVISLLKAPAGSSGRAHEPFWKREDLRFSGQGMTETEFTAMDAWLREKVKPWRRDD